MNAGEAIQNGYIGSGDVSPQFAVNLLRNGERYAPCGMGQKTLLLSLCIETEKWATADGTLSDIIKAVEEVNLDEQGIQWGTWVGIAKKVVERAGATTH